MRIARIVFVPLVVLVALLVGASAAYAQTSGWLERSVHREVARFTRSPLGPTFKVVQPQPAPEQRNWIQSHPVLFGTLVGFGGGFLIGFLPGDDAVFYDFTASFNGLVIGGVGALTGAVVAEVVSR